MPPWLLTCLHWGHFTRDPVQTSTSMDIPATALPLDLIHSGCYSPVHSAHTVLASSEEARGCPQIPPCLTFEPAARVRCDGLVARTGTETLHPTGASILLRPLHDGPEHTTVRMSTSDAIGKLVRQVRKASHCGSKQQQRSPDEVTLLLLVRTTFIWMLFFAHIPFAVNRTCNVTPAERLQHQHGHSSKCISALQLNLRNISSSTRLRSLYWHLVAIALFVALTLRLGLSQGHKHVTAVTQNYRTKISAVKFSFYKNLNRRQNIPTLTPIFWHCPMGHKYIIYDNFIHIHQIHLI